ncbi:MAG: CvpA family protein [Armatimonadota bacterium]|nr:CvpA family protein [Armatimonadota bacterium]
MDINIIDFIIIVIIITCIWIGFRRGFGKSIFDFAAVLAALKISATSNAAVASYVPILGDKQANESLIFVLSFLTLGGVFWFIGKTVYDTIVFSLDSLDPPLGSAVGFAIAIIISHVLVNSFYLAASIKGVAPDIIARSTLGFEFFEFPAYHTIMNVLFHLGE